MWMAILLICGSPDSISCNMVAKSDELFMNQSVCEAAVNDAVDSVSDSVYLTWGGCVVVGNSA
jgi:hypothetical protein